MTGKTRDIGAIDIRPAGLSDYAAISCLISSREELFRVFPNRSWPFNTRQVHYLAETRFDLTVVMAHGKVVGFANLYDLQPQQGAFIGNVVVSASYRGHGLGGRLVRHMLDTIFKVHGLPQARISVFESNKPAYALYRKLGFSIYDTEERRDPSGQKVTLLHMRLNNPLQQHGPAS